MWSIVSIITHSLIQNSNVARNFWIVEEEESEAAEPILDGHDDDFALGTKFSRIWNQSFVVMNTERFLHQKCESRHFTYNKYTKNMDSTWDLFY